MKKTITAKFNIVTPMSIGDVDQQSIDITLKGDLTKFLPYLNIGEYLNIGKEASFGLGQYQLI